jgi:hypothetical protein
MRRSCNSRQPLRCVVSGNGGWIIILGSSMAFIDGTVVNVALPALQSALAATIAEVLSERCCSPEQL